MKKLPDQILNKIRNLPYYTVKLTNVDNLEMAHKAHELISEKLSEDITGLWVLDTMPDGDNPSILVRMNYQPEASRRYDILGKIHAIIPFVSAYDYDSDIIIPIRRNVYGESELIQQLVKGFAATIYDIDKEKSVECTAKTLSYACGETDYVTALLADADEALELAAEQLTRKTNNWDSDYFVDSIQISYDNISVTFTPYDGSGQDVFKGILTIQSFERSLTVETDDFRRASSETIASILDLLDNAHKML